jgi:hypothetical protein
MLALTAAAALHFTVSETTCGTQRGSLLALPLMLARELSDSACYQLLHCHAAL